VAEPNTSFFEGVPVRRLAEPPKRSARNSLARRLTSLYVSNPATLGVSEETARFIADSVEEPDRVRKEELQRVVPIPTAAGTLHVVRASICALRVTPYMLNPRVAPLGRHPAGTRNPENVSYWPAADLEDGDGTAELVLHAGDRSRLGRAIDENQRALRSNAVGGHWRRSIRELGVRKPVMLVSLGSEVEDVTLRSLVSAEGSTRTVELHNALGIDSREVMLGRFERLEEVHTVWAELARATRSPIADVSAEQLEWARCLFVPAEIVVGFSPAEGGLADAIEGYLADVHINPQREWVESAKNDKVGDRVLEHLYRSGEIDRETFYYLAGRLTREEASGAGKDPSPARRATTLASYLLAPSNSALGRSVGEGVREATGTDRASHEKKAAIVSALAYRSVTDEPQPDRKKAELSALERAYRDPVLRDGLVGPKPWRATRRTPARLRDAALKELDTGAPGPAALEMQALASFALVRDGVLQRGRSKQKGGDPRDPQYVLRRATADPRGIHLYYRVLEDHLAGAELARPDLVTGAPQPSPTGEPVPLDEPFIREAFREGGGSQPAPSDTKGSAASARQADTRKTAKISPERELDSAVRSLVDRTRQMTAAIDELELVTDEEGPLVEREGLEEETADEIAAMLSDALGRVAELKRVHKKRYAALEALSERDETEDGDDDGND
jgi:hypothetical protein